MAKVFDRFTRIDFPSWQNIPGKSGTQVGPYRIECQLGEGGTWVSVSLLRSYSPRRKAGTLEIIKEMVMV
jgi:hypothetical protein